MSVRKDIDGSLLPAVNAAPRAVVVLTVDWSSPERTARVAFRGAAERLAAEHPALGVEWFALDEDTDWCQAWLAGVAFLGLGDGIPRGAGSMAWLEGGRLVSSELGGCSLSIADIVSRSVSLWAKHAEPGAAADDGGISAFQSSRSLGPRRG